MKNLSKVALLFCLFTIISCSKDTSGPEPNDRSGELIGTWIPVSYSITGSTTTLFFDESSVEQFEGLGAEFNYALTFAENPKTFQAVGDYILTITTTDEDGSSTTGANIFISDNGTWEKNGNIITFTLGEEIYDVTISELSDTVLKYSRNISINEVDGTSSTNTAGVENFIFVRGN